MYVVFIYQPITLSIYPNKEREIGVDNTIIHRPDLVRVKATIFVLLATTVVVNSQQPSLDVCYSQTEVSDGVATYYEEVDGGSCSFGPLFGETGPKTPYIAALTSAWFQGSSQCGICYEITSPYTNKTITAIVTDQCPTCENQHQFDLSVDAFVELGAKDIGVLKELTYRKVACQNINGNAKIKVKDGSNQWWAAFMVYNTKVGVSTVSVTLAGSTTPQSCVRKDYNYFVCDYDFTGGKFVVTVTSELGQVVTQSIETVQENQIIELSEQFSIGECKGANLLYTGVSPASTILSNNILIIVSLLLSLLSIFLF
ncbi:expansin-like protein [Cavenderia fasciculata]|uniref:Expansin-like protein n=1 Tax=Cavenderia fasciculata TaxID=261658 RepID=F4PSQ8_CACFS|nr:expansin-like protein [Cavenderia fasciculata]EGG21536.1 expansin-like protein [Cavenderia fasciculata]|eukprot:XP_004359386.1 expansin-like protein [Cavenderia fasciculata]